MHALWLFAAVVLLILASQRIESIVNLGAGGEDTAKKITREVRGAPPTSIEWMILAYVAGAKRIINVHLMRYIYMILQAAYEASRHNGWQVRVPSAKHKPA